MIYHRTHSFVSAIVICWLAASSTFGQTITTKYTAIEGQPHPDFALPEIETGKPCLLSDFRGKKVLLLHFASW